MERQAAALDFHGHEAPIEPPQTSDARQRISSNMRRRRRERRLSQEQLAELANFHRTYVSQLERCITNITIDGLARIAGALNVDIAELLDRSA